MVFEPRVVISKVQIFTGKKVHQMLQNTEVGDWIALNTTKREVFSVGLGIEFLPPSWLVRN